MNFFPQDGRKRAEKTYDRIRERRRKEAAIRQQEMVIDKARNKRGTENE